MRKKKRKVLGASEKIDKTKWGRNIEYLQKYDIEKVVKNLENRDNKLATYVFPMFNFLSYFTAGLFFMFNYGGFVWGRIKKRREMKMAEKARKRIMDKRDADEKVRQKEILDSMVVCKFCKEGGGIGLRSKQDPETGEKFYCHAECLDKWQRENNGGNGKDADKRADTYRVN